jgi:uncharacterized protein YacL
MKVYKIVEKKYLDSYGDECSKFYIKKRVLGLFWRYVEDNENDIAFRIFKGVIASLVGILINFLFTFIVAPLASIYAPLALLIIPLYITGFFLAFRGANLIDRDYFYNLRDAQDKLKTILKRNEYKNKTIDVVEVSVSKDKLIMEKKN